MVKFYNFSTVSKAALALVSLFLAGCVFPLSACCESIDEMAHNALLSEEEKQALKEKAREGDTQEQEKGPKYSIKLGQVAGWGTYGTEEVVVDYAGEELSARGDKTVGAISASLSEISTTRCELIVSNADPENAYSLRFKVTGIDSKGRSKIKRLVNTKVRAGATSRQNIACRKDLQMGVVLESGKKL